MNNLESWHQSIEIEYKSTKKMLLSDLKNILIKLNFESSKDKERISFPRSDIIEKWQTSKIVCADVFNDNEEVCFDHEGYNDWNILKLIYLLPWLPISHFEVFLLKVNEVSDALKINPSYNGVDVNFDELNKLAITYADDLTERMEAPGGEFLAQAIALNLPI
ncbi:MAG: hypothetical protein HRU38_02770 [Saccharospirillaceae bacterium]|nr:hypothetical protein [Pseudomonadales bacterium]NRB77585.1 hypothetical protein [Saccharospirillaceae bacterium]